MVVEIKNQKGSYSDIGAILFENKQSVNTHFNKIFQVAFGNNIDHEYNNYVSKKEDQYGSDNKTIFEIDDAKVDDKKNIKNDENESDVKDEDNINPEEDRVAEEVMPTVEEMLLEELANDVNVPVNVVAQQGSQVEVVVVATDVSNQKHSKSATTEMHQDGSNKATLIDNSASKKGKHDPKAAASANNQNHVSHNTEPKNNLILDGGQQSSGSEDQQSKSKTNIDFVEISKQNARVEAEAEKTFSESLKVVVPVESKGSKDMVFKSDQPVHMIVSGSTAVDATIKSTGIANIQNEPSTQSIENVERIVKGAKMSMARGNTRVEIRLDPPSLGPLIITMKSSRTGIEVQIIATTSEAKQMLDQNKDILHTALEAQGLQSVKVNVQVSVDINDEHATDQFDQQTDKDKKRDFEENLSAFFNDEQDENNLLLEGQLPVDENSLVAHVQSGNWQALEFGSVDFTV